MAMSKEAREAKNRYFREWRKRNPEKVRQHRERYWENRAKREQQEQKS